MTMLSQSKSTPRSRSNRPIAVLPELMLVLLAAACGERYQLGEVLQPVEAVATNDGTEPFWPVLVDDLGDIDARMAIDARGDRDEYFDYPVGDVDGDGYDDYLTWYNPNDSSVDTVQVLYGGPRATNGIFPAAGAGATTFAFNAETAPTLHDEAHFEGFEFTAIYARPAGDVDGDGCADILFESRRRLGGPDRPIDAWATQRAYLWYGQRERPLGDVRLDDEGVQFEPLPELPNAFPDLELDGIDQVLGLAALGDIDADGIDDIAYTYSVRVAPFDTNDNSRAATLIYYGSPERLPTRGATALYDAQIFGVELAGPLGDIDGDGSADFWMVPLLEDEYRLAWGAPERLSGEVSAATLGRAINVPYPSSNLRPAGDLDHDGIDDFINLEVSIESHVKHLFYGSPSWRSQIIDADLASASFVSDGPFGHVTPVGDWDGNGFDDLIFSQWVRPYDGVETGGWREARLIPGTAERFVGPYDIVARINVGPREEGQFGSPAAVYSIGDVDGDGFGDARLSLTGLPSDSIGAGWFIKYGGPLASDIR
jgi:hypothetical protein